MQSKDNIQKLKNLFNIFIRPFSLSFFFISLFLYLFKSYIIVFNTKFILSIGIFLGFLSFFSWFKKLNEQNIIKKIIINFCNSTFLISYCIFISDKLNLLPQNLGNAAINFIGGGSLMVGYTIIKNKIDILDIKNINIPKIKNIPPENDFSKKFPKINKITPHQGTQRHPPLPIA